MVHACAWLPVMVRCSMHSGRSDGARTPSDKASDQRTLTWPEQLAVVARYG